MAQSLADLLEPDPLGPYGTGTTDPDPTYTPTGTSGTPTPTTETSPWWTAPADGNWQQWFYNNLGRTTLTSAELKALEPDLAKAGVKVVTNAAGVTGKIQLPNGQIVDVINAAGSGGNQLQWLTDAGMSVAPDGAPISIDPSYLQPYDRVFSYEAFKGLNPQDIYNDPSYLWRLNQGKGVVENSAAARGLLNSGGTLKDLMDYGQNAASQEYSNAYDRAYNTWNTNYNNAFRNYVTARDTWYSNQSNPWQKILQAAGMGQQAASAV